MIKLVIALCLSQVAQASPMGCGEDAHCPSGFYCEATQLFCQECLRCELLKRKPPVELTTCISSAVECGACLPGLVENRGGGGSGCVPPDTGGEGWIMHYGWMAVGVVSLLCAILLLCFFAAYVLRNFEAFKIFASTRWSVRSPAETTTVATVSQPPPPPPYNNGSAPRYQDVHDDEESVWPFIKPVSSPEHVNARETAFNQSAMVYNNPTYVAHGPPVNPSLEVDDLNDVLEIRQNNENNNISTHARAVTSEHTCEIPIASARTKLHRVRQDSYTSSASSGIGDDADISDTFPFTHGSPVIINVIKNIAAVQQQNLSV